MAEIRQSPYEKGLFFVAPEPGSTLQSIGSTEWKVGERYTLKKVLGYGSNSCVCLATDHTTEEKVALKRIGDVLHSPDTAKRVLREVCILRRISHPNLISIKDCFVRPSSTGQCRMINGKLVNVSLDVYIAMEYADDGDLFHLRGQMSSDEVKSLTWQLLQALRYLHDLNIWHRDVKSQNVFLTRDSTGMRVVKLGDFGSSRSGIQGHNTNNNSILGGLENRAWSVGGIGRPGSGLARTGLGSSIPLVAPGAPLHVSDSYIQMDEQGVRAEDLYVQYEEADGGGGHKRIRGGFKAPMTRVVATPCYRAPEVVMSRGEYSAAIDTWSLGCIFGELLQRIAYVGSAATPNLHVAPLFAIRGMLKTPIAEESYGQPESLTTRKELQALFDVVGTPSWRDAALVPMEEWRRYLEKLPGIAPTLYRRFAAAGEPSIHLLSRFLEFDPERRILCEEALQHEYFNDLRADFEALGLGTANGEEPALGAGYNRNNVARLNMEQRQQQQDEQQQAIESVWRSAGEKEAGLRRASGALNGSSQAMLIEDADLQQPQQQILEPKQGEGIIASIATPSVAGTVSRTASDGMDMDVAFPTAGAAAAEGGGGPWGSSAFAVGPGLVGNTPSGKTNKTPSPYPRYWEEPDPSKALAQLEKELVVCSKLRKDSAPGCPEYDILRQMLERECEAVAVSHGGSGLGKLGLGFASPEKKIVPPLPPTQPRGSTSLSTMLRREGLVVDAGATLHSAASSEYQGTARLSNVADTVQGKELDPSKILGLGRHKEWSSVFGDKPAESYRGVPTPYRWGVSVEPPGGLAGAPVDPRLAEIIKKQQER